VVFSPDLMLSQSFKQSALPLPGRASAVIPSTTMACANNNGMIDDSRTARINRHELSQQQNA
jgi:hypothetical protein